MFTFGQEQQSQIQIQPKQFKSMKTRRKKKDFIQYPHNIQGQYVKNLLYNISQQKPIAHQKIGQIHLDQQLKQQVKSRKRRKHQVKKCQQQQNQQKQIIDRRLPLIQQGKFQQDIKNELGKQKNQELSKNNIFSFGQQEEIKYEDLKQIVQVQNIINNTYFFKKVQLGHVFKCILQRDRSGLNFIAPVYHLFLEQSGIYLISAKKKLGSFKSKYLFCRQKNSFDQENPNYLGYIQGDQGQYKLFNNLSITNEIMLIKYIPNLGVKGPRKMIALLPNQQYTPLNQQNSIKLFNKKPKWNQVLKSFALNFHGRVKVPSVKNFVMTKGKQNQTLLLFGKISDSNYHLDFQNPFNIVQAFGMAIASFDYSVS